MSSNIHLLVLVHGMWGHPGHLAEMEKFYNEIRGKEDSETGPDGERLRVIVPETNKEGQTYDGVDWGGERVAQEVLDEVQRLQDEGKKVTRFSVTGYSLGGLIARYLIGILYQRKFFDNVSPVNFTTVATPHIGLLKYPTLRSALFAYLGPRLLSRTGEQFYATDKWSATGRSILEVMADPERIFYQALKLFPHICFYGNVVNDITVPYMTAVVETEDPFADHEWNGMVIEKDEKYAPLIKSYSEPSSSPPDPPVVKTFSSEWFGKLIPPLPPVFPRHSPYNVIVFVSLPLLIPTLATLALIRLSMDTRSSRARIRLLESDDTYRERLANVAGQLEKQIEDAAVDLMESGGPAATASSTPLVSPPESPSPLSSSSEIARQKSKKKSKADAQAAPKAELSDLQIQMAASLNALPNLKKQRAYFHPIMNSHAMIVARDVKRFSFHKEGHGVLRHLADHFVM